MTDHDCDKKGCPSLSQHNTEPDYHQRFKERFVRPTKVGDLIDGDTEDILAFIDEVVAEVVDGAAELLANCLVAARAEECERAAKEYRHAGDVLGYSRGKREERAALTEKVEEMRESHKNSVGHGACCFDKLSDDLLVRLRGEEKPAASCRNGCNPQSPTQEEDIPTCPHGLTTPFCPDCEPRTEAPKMKSFDLWVEGLSGVRRCSLAANELWRAWKEYRDAIESEKVRESPITSEEKGPDWRDGEIFHKYGQPCNFGTVKHGTYCDYHDTPEKRSSVREKDDK